MKDAPLACGMLCGLSLNIHAGDYAIFIAFAVALSEIIYWNTGGRCVQYMNSGSKS